MANLIEIIYRAKDETGAQTKAVTSELRGLKSSLSAIPTAAGLVATAVAGLAVAGFTAARAFADQVEALQNISRQTGVTVNDIVVLERVTKDAGLGAGAASQALVMMGRSIARNDPLLAAMGITTRNAFEALIQFGEAARNTSDANVVNEASMKLLNRSGAELAKVLRDLGPAASEARAALSAEGGLFTAEQIANAERLDKILDEWDRKWSSISKNIAAAAASFALWLMDPISGTTRANLNAKDPAMRQGGFIPPAHEGGGGGRTIPSGGAAATSLTEYANRYADFVHDIQLKSRPLGDLYTVFFGTKLEGVAAPATQAGAGAGGFGASIAQQGAAAFESAFSTAFASILQKGFTLGRALVSIFQAVGQSLLARVGGGIAGGLLGFLFGGPGGAAAGFAAGIAGNAAGPARTGGDTYIIQTYETRDTLQQLRAPGGVLRRANDRLVQGAAY